MEPKVSAYLSKVRDLGVRFRDSMEQRDHQRAYNHLYNMHVVRGKLLHKLVNKACSAQQPDHKLWFYLSAKEDIVAMLGQTINQCESELRAALKRSPNALNDAALTVDEPPVTSSDSDSESSSSSSSESERQLKSAAPSGAVLDGPSIVYVYAEWCGHCRQFSPVFDDLERTLKSIPNSPLSVVKIDADSSDNKDQQRIKVLGTTGFPSLYFVHKGGRPIVQFQGDRSVDGLLRFIIDQLQNSTTV